MPVQPPLCLADTRLTNDEFLRAQKKVPAQIPPSGCFVQRKTPAIVGWPAQTSN